MTIQTIFKPHTGGAMEKKDQPEWNDLRPISRTLSRPRGKPDYSKLAVRWLCAGFQIQALRAWLKCDGVFLYLHIIRLDVKRLHSIDNFIAFTRGNSGAEIHVSHAGFIRIHRFAE
jgi:hypothetical protein